MAIPLLLWLVIWAVGEGDVLGLVVRREASWQVAALWLAPWTLSGLWALAILLWRLVGEVVIEVSGGELKYRSSVGLFSSGKTYDLHLIRELRAAGADDVAERSSWTVWQIGRGRGRIRFTYGERSVTLRPGLAPTEARNLVNMLGPYLRPRP